MMVVIDRIYRLSVVALAVICLLGAAGLYFSEGAGAAGLGFFGLALLGSGVLMDQISR
jgi:hypothetical protein